MPGRDSSRIRNGALIQWAYDQLALCREAGTLVQFRKVKAHRTDNSPDSKRNREADKLANQGRLMDLEEFGFPPDPLHDMAAEPAHPVLHPLDWAEVLADRIPPADSRTGVPLPAVDIPHPVPPMLSATQSDTTHSVPPSMHIHPVPCNDTHPKFTSSTQLPLGPAPDHRAFIAVNTHPVSPMLTATQYDSTHTLSSLACVFTPSPAMITTLILPADPSRRLPARRREALDLGIPAAAPAIQR